MSGSEAVAAGGEAGAGAGVEADGGARVEADEEPEDESSPAENFGTKLGVGLTIVALVWAFVGPSHLLEVGRYELPIVASFVEPLQVTYLLYVGGLTFLLALVGGIAFPAVDPEAGDDYEGDLAMGLIIPPIVVVLVMAVLGFVFPALFYLVGGEVVRAGLILGGIVVVAVVAFLVRTITLVALAVATAPLWVPSFAGAYAGGFLGGVIR